MAQETKTVSIRLTQDIINWLSNYGESVTKQITNVVEEHKSVVEVLKDHIDTNNLLEYNLASLLNRNAVRRSIAMNDLRGVFTPHEWQWMAASMNGIIIQDEIRFSKEVFVWHCEDYQKYNPAEAGQWEDVTPEGIAKKVEPLSGIHIEAIYDRIAEFWSKNTEIDFDTWSKY